MHWPFDRDDTIWLLRGGLVVTAIMIGAITVGAAWRLFVLVSGIGG